MTDKDVEKQAEQLVAYLDCFMQKGGGHVNVRAGSDVLQAQEFATSECFNKNSPCRIPNLKQEGDM